MESGLVMSKAMAFVVEAKRESPAHIAAIDEPLEAGDVKRMMVESGYFCCRY